MPRIVTYNVHRCVGNDRRLDVARIVDVLAKLEPDIVALLAGDPRAFERRFADTPFERPGVSGMRRNAAAVLANRRRTRP